MDVEDLLTQEEIDTTLEKLYEKGSNVKETYSGPEYQNLDIYQVNCTYYSALGSDDDPISRPGPFSSSPQGSPRSIMWACWPVKTTSTWWKNSPGPEHQPPQLYPGRDQGCGETAGGAAAAQTHGIQEFLSGF